MQLPGFKLEHHIKSEGANPLREGRIQSRQPTIMKETRTLFNIIFFDDVVFK
jgi:hypothetical protein